MLLIRLIFFTLIQFILVGCHERVKMHPPLLGKLPITESWLTYSDAPKYSFTIIHSYPHNPRNFTEGFLMDNGYVYESTGLYQESTLQKYDLKTGEIERICGNGCVKCYICLNVCSEKAIYVNKKGLPVIDYSKCNECNECFLCVRKCPTGVIKRHKE